jgi:hypothetical protein
MRNVRVICILAVCLFFVFVAGCGRTGVSAAAPQFDTPYQAVLLDTGLVYYGRVSGLDTAFPVLRDVYYIQQTTDPQTKQVSNILIRRGNEWHGPSETVLNARHIVMVEPVGKDSKVAQLIEEQIRKK